MKNVLPSLAALVCALNCAALSISTAVEFSLLNAGDNLTVSNSAITGAVKLISRYQAETADQMRIGTDSHLPDRSTPVPAASLNEYSILVSHYDMRRFGCPVDVPMHFPDSSADSPGDRWRRISPSIRMGDEDSKETRIADMPVPEFGTLALLLGAILLGIRGLSGWNSAHRF